MTTGWINDEKVQKSFLKKLEREKIKKGGTARQKTRLFESPQKMILFFSLFFADYHNHKHRFTFYQLTS
jgi:hypothetical protein